MHNKYNAIESSPNHPHLLPQFMEKQSSMKPVPVPKTLGTFALKYFQKSLHSLKIGLGKILSVSIVFFTLSCHVSSMDSLGAWGGGSPVSSSFNLPYLPFASSFSADKYITLVALKYLIAFWSSWRYPPLSFCGRYYSWVLLLLPQLL